MKMYEQNLEDRKNGRSEEIGVETKFGQKTACPDMATFLPNFYKESTGFKIWKDLAEVWNIQIFGHLNI